MMFRRTMKDHVKSERGEVMLEGMLIMVLTMFILVWILGLGFLYYQRYTVTIVTNDTAAKIASVYNNPTSDIVLGYVTPEELIDRDLYRNFSIVSMFSNLEELNQDKAECYVKYTLEKVNFFNVVKDVKVNVNLVKDSWARKHVEVTTMCSFNTPFGIGLDMFGMGKEHTYSVTACADCTDILEYSSAVGFQKSMLHDGKLVSGSGMLDSIVKMINSFVKTYNQLSS